MGASTGPIAWAARGLRGAANLPGRLVGPIFTKELRVSSRRRRNFVLRAVYLAALTAFVALVWYAAMRFTSFGYGYGSHAARVERMHTAGLTVVACVVWFQFCAVLLVTIIMLSTSISEEVYHRTLGVLMTTPIQSFQIVVGKLLSKVLQLVMLLALSLPVLAVVRVLGGVPWDFLIRSLCVTLSTVVLFAAVTMFISIRFRRAFVSILLALCTVAFFYGGLPLIVALWVAAFEIHRQADLMPLLSLLLHYNPFAAQTVLTVELIQPRGAAMMGMFVWWINCVVTLGLAALVLAACVAMVRRAALRQAAGPTGAGPSSSLALALAQPPPLRSPAIPMAGHPGPPGPPESSGPADPPPFPPVLQPLPDMRSIRPITGSPVLWRELRPNWARGRTAFWVGGGIAAVLLLLVYGLVGAIDNCISQSGVHAAFIFVYTIIAAIVTAVLSATTITAEKEANSWDILLCTTLSDWHILGGKAAGVVRRCLPIWLLPLGHGAIFMVAGLAHPVLLLHLALVAVSVTGLLTGSGLYFSSHFKRTTTAVILNLSLAIALWAALPGFLALGTQAVEGGEWRNPLQRLTEYIVDANPVFQATTVTACSTGRHAYEYGTEYRWEWAGMCNGAETMSYLARFTGIYLLLGATFAWRAKCRLRRKIY